MPLKPREMEKLILATDGFSRIRKVPTEIAYIQQNLEKSQYLFIKVKT